MSCWYLDEKHHNDVAVSSRVRLARNIVGLPFSHKMNDTERKELNQKVKTALLESEVPFVKKLKFISISDVPQNEINAMVERHIISPEFAALPYERSIIISDDETVCVMVGEEDHIRIQVILGGLQLSEAYSIASSIDDILAAKLNFAYDNELGYLTQCPTNLGTGMRASVMLHLPFINNNKKMNVINDAVSKIGFTVRGMYGEGSKAKASLYQISNQITLGITEQNAITNLDALVKQIIDAEMGERRNVSDIELKDYVFRAYGILKYQHLLSTEEMFDLISKIKVGISLGIIEIEKTLPNKILIETQPAMLIRKYGDKTPQERDALRAELVRGLF